MNPADLISSVDLKIEQIRTRSVDVSFNELFDMHSSDELIINPSFQRMFRWPEAKQSQFIESLVLELPVPAIYVIEMEGGEYELIDGLQRISSYLHFRGVSGVPRADEGNDADDSEGNEELPLVPSQTAELPLEQSSTLRLSGCDVLPQLNGRTFSELPSAIQIKLKRHFIRMEVLRRENDKELKYHMFKRLNTGGEILSTQEVRNCTIRLLSPKFADWLVIVAKSPSYLRCMQELTLEKRRRMYLEEYALRFFALKNFRSEYDKEIGIFLTSYMEQVSRGDLPFDYEGERAIFEKTFELLSLCLSERVFSGFNANGNAQGYFSVLHFEALSIGIQSVLSDVDLSNDSVVDLLRECLLKIKKDNEFGALVKGGGKNYSRSLEDRISYVGDRVAECLKG